jgi:thiaminase/transcriptional activator TenA
MSAFVALCQDNDGLHRAALSHPVVRAIGDGSLAPETFRFYLEQDYQFLLRYARVLAQAVSASPDLPTARRLADLLRATLAVEIDALVDLYDAFEGVLGRLDQIAPAPTCQAYTDHLLVSAASDELLVILAAILPCQWGYREIGRDLARRGLPAHPGYARWIEEYASEEYGELVDWLTTRFDQLAAGAGYPTLERASTAFELSSRYELGFWEMAGSMQGWPEVGGAGG